MEETETRHEKRHSAHRELNHGHEGHWANTSHFKMSKDISESFNNIFLDLNTAEEQHANTN